ncbi:STAS-like domain-containing protein [Oceanicaulis alexandrii]|uniref:STAS-like domain-containing protein n=1 Tax=Oceanicaulis alexandrii TaxID=153233 RepID=UPI002355477B|nr:STAS-like domain-containing protein [Oceanicaulis alexandrii]
MDDTAVMINISKDFSFTPGPRYRKQGAHSGEAFREGKLVPALKLGGVIKVVFDGTAGFGSSFIDEAFGGLVRVNGYDANELLKRFSFVSNEDPLLIEDAKESIKEARPA